MQYSHSRIETFEKCPHRYNLRYNLKLTGNEKDFSPSNALYLGTALHTGIEKGVGSGIQSYKDNYVCLSNDHIHEIMKLEHWIPRVREVIPKDSMFEYKLETPDFIGYIDLLIPLGNNHYAIYDFKYSNAVDRYLESRQLHEYKHYYELINPDHKIVELGYIFIPKVFIRQKQNEDLFDFRRRLKDTLNGLSVQTIKVPFEENKVKEFFLKIKEIETATEFPRNKSKLCNYCEFKKVCEVDNMFALPKNETRTVHRGERKKLWIYGDPYSGKTTFAAQFPDPIFLNTDGNIYSFDKPYVSIKDTLDGRQTVPAWKMFKTYLDLLQQGSEYKTIVVDLLEDCLEHCRHYVLTELGLRHESEVGFGKAHKMVDDEFFGQFKRLCNMDYNVLLLSHANTSDSITYGNGTQVTKIQPNIKEKYWNPITGYVDATARVLVTDEGRYLDFTKRENKVGGGRLVLPNPIIPLSYEALCQAYTEADTPKVVTEQSEDQPRRRRVVE